MSEIKPCMNDGCANYALNHSLDGTNCKKIYPNDLEKCPKYSDTPPPKPFTPKNPDDYLPGCRNPNCQETKTDGLFHCLFADWYENACDMGKECHSALCSRVPCYDPEPKPKTQNFMTLKIPMDNDKFYVEINKAGKCTVYEVSKTRYVMKDGSILLCDISAGIITEEIKQND